MTISSRNRGVGEDPGPQPGHRPNRRGGRSPPDLVADSRAIEQILQAERDAETDVRRSFEESEAQVARARQTAHRIADRADERIRWLRGRLARATDVAITELQQQHQDRERESQRRLTERTVLDTAVAHVADWLLGEEEPT